MTKRINAIEIVKSYENDNVLATIWWDGTAVKSDNPDFLADLKADTTMQTSVKDGPRWINEVAQKHKNGYLHARRAK